MEASFLRKYLKYSQPKLKEIAQREFNRYIRTRDSASGAFRCISCGKLKSVDKMHAGHFWSAGGHGSVRFDEDNVHGQCSRCNTHLHGDLINYDRSLVNKIGEERYRRLEVRAHQLKKWDKVDLISIIYEYRTKNKQP